jgi:methylenetetrahydrofolate--tRNA-(uracil-5-)-methyltransferase
MSAKSVRIIGGGLAGSEAAFFLLKKGYDVELYERRPKVE